jgi:hypothetical protein
MRKEYIGSELFGINKSSFSDTTLSLPVMKLSKDHFVKLGTKPILS